MTTSSIGISIVIPVYNGGDSFRKCLASINESLRLPDEVVVVSDGDTDGSCCGRVWCASVAIA